MVQAAGKGRKIFLKLNTKKVLCDIYFVCKKTGIYFLTKIETNYKAFVKRQGKTNEPLLDIFF